MSNPNLRISHHEVLVIGAGVAGLSTALGLGRATVLTNAPIGVGGSSPMAQGGVAVALGLDDSPADHGADTLSVAGGIGNAEVVEVLTSGGPAAVAQLRLLGARFDGADSIEDIPSLGREAGHGRRRIVHANGDATGAEIMRALTQATLAAPGIDVLDKVEVIDLAVSADGAVCGAIGEQLGERVLFLAPRVVLATGGYGHCFANTTTPEHVMGAGIAMAARAGAAIADMEFVQFHPTALAVGGNPMPLLTEALRGEGAVLVNETGERYMLDIHPDAELAPRDVVARANYRQLKAGHTPYLDARAAVGDSFPDRFPTVFALATSHGLDPRVDLLPVSPAAHYCMGGIAVDAEGGSSLDGLWAVGEVTSSGVHGANRLASNSLLEGLVMGARAAENILASGVGPGADDEVLVPMRSLDASAVHPASAQPALLEKLRELLWISAGVERDAVAIGAAMDQIRVLGAADSSDRLVRNTAVVGELILSSALARTESRGAHFRTDYPGADPAQARRSITQIAAAPQTAVQVFAPTTRTLQEVAR